MVCEPRYTNGFRYLPAEPIPWAAGMPPAVDCVRERLGAAMALSLGDTSPAVLLSPPPCMSATQGAPLLQASGGRLGYRTTIASDGACGGDLLYEVTWRGGDPQAGLRFGLGRIGATPDGPVGCDAFGYAWCASGKKAHCGRVEAYAAPFERGDVLACRITFGPDGAAPTAAQLMRRASQSEVVCQGRVYLEERLPPTTVDDRPPCRPAADGGALPGRASDTLATIQFYRNGVAQGIAFAIPSPRGEAATSSAAVFYPMVSLYRDAVALLNFGPTLVHWPPPLLEGSGSHHAVSPSSQRCGPFCQAHTDNVIASGLRDLQACLGEWAAATMQGDRDDGTK